MSKKTSSTVWTKKEHWAPFDDRGTLLSYPITKYRRNDDGSHEEFDISIWKDVTKPFRAKLICYSYGRGRSSVVFKFRDVDTQATYEMFVSHVFDLINSGAIQGDEPIEGMWEVVKRGQNYAIRYLGL